MRATRPWVRAELRRRLGAVAALALVMALSSAFVLATLAGARRADTAWTRFAALAHMPTMAGELPADSSDAIAGELRSRPEVTDVARFLWMPVAPEGAQPGVDAATFAAIDASFGTTVARPVVMHGRLADEARADEVTVNEPLARRRGVHVGDRLVLKGEVGGIEQPVTVVGITRGFLEQANPGGAFVQTTAAFWSAWGPAYLRALTEAGEVRGLRLGLFATTRTLADAETVSRATTAAHPDLNLGAGSIPNPSADLTHPVVVALAGLAAVAAIAVVVVVGLAAGRLVRASAADRATLAAIGVGRGERATAAVAVAGAGIGTGALLAVPLAWLASAWLPFGPVRQVEPSPGRYLDLGLVALAALGVAALALAVSLTGLRRDRRPTSRKARLPLLALGVPAAVGVAGATGSGGGGRARGRATIVGLLVGVTGIVAVSTLATSLSELLSTPHEYGWRFDTALFVEAGDGARPVEAARDDPAVLAAAHARLAQVALGDGTTLDAYGIEPLRGDVYPPLLQGRAAGAPDEIVLAPGSARQSGAGVGDEVHIGDATYRVVGIAVVPPLGNADFGSAAVLTPAGLDRTGTTPEPSSMLLVRTAPGTDHEALAQSLGASGEVVDPFLPNPLKNLSHVRAAPAVLGAFLGLLGLAALAYGMSFSVRSRRHELAVLRSLGCSGGQLRRSVLAEALATGIVALAVGVPLGILAGRWLCRLLLAHLPVAELGAPSWPAVGVVAAGTLVAGALLSVLPGHRAARLAPARVLRAE